MRDQTRTGATSDHAVTFLPASLPGQGWLHRALPGGPPAEQLITPPPTGRLARRSGALGDSTGGRKREFLLNEVRQSHRVRPSRPRRRQKWPRSLPAGQTVLWALLPYCHLGALSRTAGQPLGSPRPQGQGTFPNREGLPQSRLLNPLAVPGRAPLTRPAPGWGSLSGPEAAGVCGRPRS